MDINTWLESFKTHWQNRDSDKMSLMFTDCATFFVDPFLKIDGEGELSKYWKNTIHGQEDINLHLKVFSSCENKHTVLWHLSYYLHGCVSYPDTSSGTYLIELDDDGLCTYFHIAGKDFNHNKS